jgi:hypothetical protein
MGIKFPHQLALPRQTLDSFQNILIEDKLAGNFFIIPNSP